MRCECWCRDHPMFLLYISSNTTFSTENLRWNWSMIAEHWPLKYLWFIKPSLAAIYLGITERMAIQNRKLLINHLTIFIQYLIHTFRSTRKREAVQKARSFVHINSVDKGSIIDIALYEYENFMGRCNDDDLPALFLWLLKYSFIWGPVASLFYSHRDKFSREARRIVVTNKNGRWLF